MTDTITNVHRVTLLVIDHDHLGAPNVTREIENVNYPNDCISPKVVAIETRAVDWSDDHPLNQRVAWRAAYEALFPTASPTELAELRAVAGALYAKLLQTTKRLGQHESTAKLEIDLALVHVELGKLGVV